MSYLTKEFYEWSNSDVCNWMHSKNLRTYIERFEQKQISGYDMCFISNEDLKVEFNIANLHERLAILKEIKKLMMEYCM
jgi:hypothetical protein